MPKLTPSTLRQWARIGQRGIYGQSLHSLATSHSNLFAISADLGNSSGLDRFKRDFPDRFLNIGIAEQNLVGFSSGLSSTGQNVFISSFAPFLTMRACEQVRMNLSYMRSNVKLVSIGSGISMGYLGNSHFGLEDISIIRSMPNIPILNPSDCYELYQMCSFLASYDGPAYLRLTGIAPCTPIHELDYQFNFASLDILSRGSDLLVLTYGAITSQVLEACKVISASVQLVNVHTLSPVPDELADMLSSYSRILVIEEHFSVGGLGSIVSEIISKNYLSPEIFHHLSLNHSYLSSGTYPDLLSHYNLDVNSLCSSITSILEEN